MLDVLKNILEFLGDVLQFIFDAIEWVIVKIFLVIAEGVIFLLNLIPVPGWMGDISGNIAAIDPGILFFVAPFQFTTGLAWVVSAYVLRFLIRRIPVIG